MRNQYRVAFSEVRAKFRSLYASYTSDEYDTRSQTELTILYANEPPCYWTRALLNRTDILNVVLPWHKGCGGNIELIQPEGLTVAQAVVKLGAIRERFALENAICWQKILRSKFANHSPIFLTTRAIETEDYANLQVRQGLVHLDGLHRMIGWEYQGLLKDSTLIEAYISTRLDKQHPTMSG